jgi:anthranilate phosphoribosyltransferase
VVEVADGELRKYTVSPEDVGLQRAAPETVPGGDPQQNADTARSIFGGARGAARDLAVFNAGAAIYAGGRADSLEQGVRVAEQAVDGGMATAALERFVAHTRQLAGP